MLEQTITGIINKLSNTQDFRPEDELLIAEISRQKLYLIKEMKVKIAYDISTSKNGIGNRSGSMKTPLGTHLISGKFGDDVPENGILKRKIFTGKIAEIDRNVQEDLITSRIFILRGLEDRINRGNGIDSEKRNIWIHGTQAENLIGRQASHGCIRLRNKDVIDMYSRIPVNTIIEIIP